MRGAIATPHALATQAGVRAYAAGGNAIDAALAAAATLTVVYPHQCAIGGDLMALLDDGAGTLACVNGSGAAAAQASASALRARYSEMPEDGTDTITVPGLVAGWQSLHGLGAHLSVARLLEPAIEAAADGVAVSPSLAAGIRYRGAALLHRPAIGSLFMPDGVPLRQGALLRQPQLARTLQSLAADGLGSFYTGAIGALLVSGLQRLGSALTAADFTAHRSELCAPLRLAHRGAQIHTSPPNSQGFALLEAITALDALGIAIDPLGDAAPMLLRALRMAAEDRDRYLGDPRRVSIPLQELLAAPLLRERLLARAAGRSLPLASAGRIPAHGDTVAVCAMDSAGRAVSLIQSVYQSFGSMVIEPATGVIFHNRGRGFSLLSGAANEFVPGTRPAHTLSPVLMHREGRAIVALGTMGGRAQPQILAQLIPGIFDPGASLAAVLGAPRWVTGIRDIDFARPTIAIEADAPEHLDAALRIEDLDLARIPARDERVGHAQLVTIRPDGVLRAASDPRSDGAAEVCPA
jgi:gamma-glutamyltranspeptidase/glutathione hydrolase